MKAIEMILGLPPVLMLDSIAAGMFNGFQIKPDFTLYLAFEPLQSNDQANLPPASQ